ncbi:flagellar hook-length control protein FliK [Metabacillus malikii]|uniref:Protein required for attachment to host cells n=1 Tax=Metabacillus malikii TaxID=1504265 RepID=A0ABT9ZE34_9BACI|nr:flagellar hook-length control protein FliK [Metabacillus malikii]MDQ0230531.1 protein required for attachment to host cells [Metabacillus malikii]
MNIAALSQLMNQPSDGQLNKKAQANHNSFNQLLLKTSNLLTNSTKETTQVDLNPKQVEQTNIDLDSVMNKLKKLISNDTQNGVDLNINFSTIHQNIKNMNSDKDSEIRQLLLTNINDQSSKIHNVDELMENIEDNPSLINVLTMMIALEDNSESMKGPLLHDINHMLNKEFSSYQVIDSSSVDDIISGLEQLNQSDRTKLEGQIILNNWFYEDVNNRFDKLDVMLSTSSLISESKQVVNKSDIISKLDTVDPMLPKDVKMIINKLDLSALSELFNQLTSQYIDDNETSHLNKFEQHNQDMSVVNKLNFTKINEGIASLLAFFRDVSGTIEGENLTLVNELSSFMTEEIKKRDYQQTSSFGKIEENFLQITSLLTNLKDSLLNTSHSRIDQMTLTFSNNTLSTVMNNDISSVNYKQVNQENGYEKLISVLTELKQLVNKIKPTDYLAKGVLASSIANAEPNLLLKISDLKKIINDFSNNYHGTSEEELVNSDSSQGLISKEAGQQGFTSISQSNQSIPLTNASGEIISSNLKEQQFTIELSQFNQTDSSKTGEAKFEQPQRQEFSHQLVQAFRTSRFAQMPNGANRLVIRLNPDHLGSLTVKLVQRNGEMVAKIITSTNSAKELLDHSVHQLKQVLPNVQIEIERFEVPTQQQQNASKEQSEQKEQKQQHLDKSQTDDDVEENTSFIDSLNEVLNTSV